MASKMLLISKDPQLTAVCLLNAEKMDCEVVQCSSLKEANESISTPNLDLVLIDKQMPDGGGIDWTNRLRCRGVNTPIILATKETDEKTDFRRLLQLSSCLLLQKPISPSLLLAVSKPFLDKNNPAHCIAFEQLKQDFSIALPSLLRALSELLLKSEGPPIKKVLVLKAARLAHRIRGSSVSFGFLNISEQLSWLEDKLRSMLECDKATPLFHPWLTYRRTVADILMSLRTKQAANSKFYSVPIPRITCFTRDKSFASRLRALLNSEGIMVYTLENASYASDAVLCTFPDILLADPEDLSLTELAIIQEMSDNWKLPLVLSSPRTKWADKQSQLIQPYKLFFIQKQMNNIELMARIAEILEKRMQPPFRLSLGREAREPSESDRILTTFPPQRSEEPVSAA